MVGDTPIAQLDDATLARLACTYPYNGASREEKCTVWSVISKATAEIEKRTVGESVVPDMKLLRGALEEEKERAAELEVRNEECKKRMDFLEEMISVEEELIKMRKSQNRAMELKKKNTKRMRYEAMMEGNRCFAKCKRACRRFEEFHKMEVGGAEVESVRKSSAGIEGWASSA